ncbi:MAG: COG1361 S-layer family protein [Lachnospiraceae bacterium]|nr:COG1361 S-layer family protein [Lachnospiraceae bacterium]
MKRLRELSKITTVLVLAAMIFCMFGKTDVYAASNYLVPAKATGRFDFQIEPGEVRHYLIPVKVTDAALNLFSLSADASNDDLMISNVKLSDPKSTTEPDYSTGFFVQHGVVYNLEFDVTASDALKIGYNSVTFSGSGHAYYSDGTNMDLNNDLLLSLTSYTATELKPIEVVVDKITLDESAVYPGNSFTIKLKLKNTGERQALNTYLSMNFNDSGIIPDYKVENIKVGTIGAGSTASVDVPVTVLKNAEPGFYNISAVISCKDSSGTAQGPFVQNMYITVNKLQETEEKKEQPVISLSTSDNYKIFNPDTEDSIKVTLKNVGEADAKNVRIAIKSGLDTSIGLTKGFTTDTFYVGDIKAGKEATVSIPVIVAKNFPAGLYEIQMESLYEDEKENEKTSQTMTMYVKGPQKEAEKEGHGSVSITNVSQSPESPVAGEKVTISFDVVNDGTADITNVKVSGTGLSSSGFEPVSSEPYKKVGTIKAGSRARVSLTFKVGKDIPSGFNTLNVNCEYTDENNMTGSESAGLYVLNVVNESKEGDQKTSKPKLIISQYSTEPIVDWDNIGENDDIEKLQKELRAGGTFDFKYSLKNTHVTKSAKNIKITLEQAEGYFAPTEGSNIFYIEEIPAGETVEQVIRLKTRSDVATGDYTLSVRVEYEYDDMSEVDTERGGVTDENSIKLHAVENYRPEIENIYIDSYEGVMVGVPVDLSFEFYNMGRSSLGNVYVTIEGDFALANNATKSYIGSVGGYGQEYCNPQIVALVPGEATGIVVVHFEDSNGDEQTKTAEFNTYVMDGGDFGDYYPDYGNLSGGYYVPDYEGDYDPDMDFGDDFEGAEDGEGSGKIIGLPVWLFIVICSAVGVAVIVVIVVVVKKKRKKALLDDEDDE